MEDKCVFNDGETESRSRNSSLMIVTRAVISVPNKGELILGNAHTRIRHGYSANAVKDPCFNVDTFILTRIVDCVADKIVNDLKNKYLVCFNGNIAVCIKGDTLPGLFAKVGVSVNG